MNHQEELPAPGPNDPTAEQAPQPAIPPKVLGRILQVIQSIHCDLVAEIAMYPGPPESEAYYLDVKLQGMIDAANKAEQILVLRQSLLKIAQRNDVAGIILNFEQVQFVDSYFQGNTIALHKSLLELQKPLVLHSLPAEGVAESFMIAKLDSILMIAEDIRSALLRAMEPTQPIE